MPRPLPLLLLLAACGQTPVAKLDRPANETCAALDRPASTAEVTFTEVWPTLRFSQPVAMRQPPVRSDTAWWYIVEQGGTIVRFEADSVEPTLTTVLDVGDLLMNPGGNEWGLLGMDFHPDFANNGYMYVNYTGSLDGDFTSFIVRYTSTDGGATFDPGSAKEILHLYQPYSNHNGGNLLFGPDGYLYIGFGDGGYANDPLAAGQDTEVLLGKMLRIDVDGGDPYAIPADNPFAAGGGAPEIYAWGLRNPWRYSFDTATGELWVGDVGQDKWEEIDLVELGGNYGWDAKEGTHCFEEDPCEDGPWIDPIVEYKHNDDGGVTVTGGYVYRGANIPALAGTYLYADGYYGRFWALTFDAVTGEAAPTVLAENTGYYPVSFGQDYDGEVYFTEWMAGRLYRIDPAEAAPEPDGAVMPTLLSETGCVDPANPIAPAAGMISYDVNSPLWSDGADKSRWFAIPDGTTIDVNDDGTWTFPVGSVLVKQFRDGDTPMETRLMVLHDDGYWTGYSYAWNETGTDAELLTGSSSGVYGTRDWSFPSRAECLRCHTSAPNYVLGLRTEQMNGQHTYEELGGGTYNQMEALQAMGFFSSDPGTPDTLTTWANPGGSGDGVQRGRSYIAANCAFCHLPEGTGGGAMDLRYDTPFAEMGICETAPVNGDLGVEGAVLFDPMSPTTSVLALRMGSIDAHRMPPLATSVVDDVGLAAVQSWITETAACD